MTPLEGDPRYLADGKWSVTYDLARGLKLSSDTAESQPVIGRRAALSAREQTCTRRPVLRQIINLLRSRIRALVRSARNARGRQGDQHLQAGSCPGVGLRPPRSRGAGPLARCKRAPTAPGIPKDRGGRSRKAGRRRGRGERGCARARIASGCAVISRHGARARLMMRGRARARSCAYHGFRLVPLVSLRLNRPESRHPLVSTRNARGWQGQHLQAGSCPEERHCASRATPWGGLPDEGAGAD